MTRTLSAAALPHVYWLARIASQSRFADEARLFAPDVIRRQLGAAEYLGTAEMTRWSDLLDPERALPLLAVIEDARRLGKINDGHMAGASPRRLAALATTGIRSCHEAINAEEALGRLRQGCGCCCATPACARTWRPSCPASTPPLSTTASPSPRTAPANRIWPTMGS